MFKIRLYIIFLFLAQIGFSQQINVFNVVRTGNFNCGSAPNITAEIIEGSGSSVVDGALVIDDPCGYTTIRVNMANLRYNQPGANWPHGFFFPTGENISVSNVTLPAGWIAQDSCTGASCSAQDTGGIGFYYDGTGSSCTECNPVMGDGSPSNNYGQSSMNCSTPFLIAFDMTFCNSRIETTTTDFILQGSSDGNTGCWSTPDVNTNTVTFSINTVESDVILFDPAPINTEVITVCEGSDMNYLVALTGGCGNDNVITWWTEEFGGTMIGTGSPFTYDAPGNVCPEGTIIYAQCCPEGTICDSRTPVVIGPCSPPSDTPTFNPIDPQCPGGENPLPDTSIEGYTGTWSPVFDPNNTQTYTFTPTPGQCATEPVEVLVEILTSMVPTFNEMEPICQNSTPPTLPTPNETGITGTWDPPVIDTSTPGVFLYTFDPDDNCAEEVTIEITIVEEIIPDFVDMENQYCQTDEIIELPDLSDNGYQGTWSPSNQVDLNVIGTTEYTFTPADADCFQSFVIQITVEETLIPTFNEMDPICQNSTPPVLPNPTEGGITGTWDPPVIDTSTPGVYDYVFLTDGNCSEDVTIQIEIVEELAVEVDMPLSYCQGDEPVTLPTTLDSGVTGTWVPAVIDTGTPGTDVYTFYPEAGLCALDTPFTIEIYPQPVLNTVPTIELCDDDFNGIFSTDLTDLNAQLGGGAGIAYEYYASLADFNSDIPIPTGQWNNYNFPSLPATIYVVGESGEGCRSAEIPVQFIAGEEVNHNTGPFGPIEYCPEDTVDLTQFEGAIGAGGVTLAYFNTIEDARNQTNEIINTAEFTPAQTQTSVIVRLDEAGFCSAFVEILLERLATPSLELSHTSMVLCEDDSFEATATSDDPDATYEWTLGDGTILTGPIQTIDQIGIYTVVAYSADGCISEERTLTVNLPSLPVINGLELGDNFVVVSASNNGEGPLEYSLDGVLWQSSPQFSNLIPGETYTIWVRSSGCMIQKYDVTILSVPNFISPNGDGKNDTWTIRGINATPGATVKIFDRYGKIFVDTNFEGNYEWNGKYLGNNVPSGDYWYIIQVPSDGIVQERKFVGHITVRNK